MVVASSHTCKNPLCCEDTPPLSSCVCPSSVLSPCSCLLCGFRQVTKLLWSFLCVKEQFFLTSVGTSLSPFCACAVSWGHQPLVGAEGEHLSFLGGANEQLGNASICPIRGVLLLANGRQGRGCSCVRGDLRNRPVASPDPGLQNPGLQPEMKYP